MKHLTKMQKAAESYQQGTIPLSEAARRAEITLWEMETYLVQKGYISSYSLDTLKEECALLEKSKS